MPSPAAVMAAIGQMPGMKASGATPSTVAARAAVSREAWGARQRLVPYHTPAIALPIPYSPSSDPAAALSPWRAAQAGAAKRRRRGAGYRRGRRLAVPQPGQAQHAGHAERGGHQHARDRCEAGGQRHGPGLVTPGAEGFAGEITVLRALHLAGV